MSPTPPAPARRAAPPVLAAAAVALLALPAVAQLDDPAPLNRAVLPGEGDLDAVRLFKMAREAAGARNWPEAARAYAGILGRFHPDERRPGAVLPVGDPPDVFVGAADTALREIAALPPEAHAALQTVVEADLRAALEDAVAGQDDAALERLMDRWPFAEAAGQAFAHAVRRLVVAGRLDGAAALADRFLRLPARVVPPAAVARLVTVLAAAGDRARLAAVAERIGREASLRGAPVRVGGRETSLAPFAEGELGQLPPAPAAAAGAPPGWPQYGGDPAGGRLMHPAPEPFRPVAAIPVAAGWAEGFLDEPASFPVEVSIPPTLFPAIAEGFCYVVTDRSVTAHALDAAGPPAAGAPAPAPAKAREPVWRLELPPVPGYRYDDRTVNAATVHRGRVYAALVVAVTEIDQQSFICVKYPFARRALVALDAWTGRLLWKVGGALEGDDLVERLTFALPPSPDGDLLYAGAVLQPNSTDPFAHYVVCLEAETGRVRWRTYVAQGQHEVNLFNNPIRDSLGTAVTVAGDTLYYGTNLGAIAALDRLTGRIRWIRKYDQMRIEPPRNIYTQPRPLRWSNNPVFVAAGTVCVSPLDAFNAFGFDAATGAQRMVPIPHGGDHGEMWRYLLGVKGSLLYVSGRELMAVDLAAGGRRRWIFAPPGEAGAGRGGVTPTEVLFPTDHGLHRVDLATGRPLAFRPWARAELEAGNVVSADGFLVAAGPQGVTLFETASAPQALGEEALARDPGNLMLRVRAGARALADGRPADGERLFREVLERAAARPGNPDAERAAWLSRRQLVLHLARESLRVAEADPARARALLAEARTLGDDPAAAREQALRLGEALRARHPETALAVLQEGVLEEAAKEAPPAAGAAPGGGPAGDAVRDASTRAIEAILAAHGRDYYIPWEARAREALAAARRDPSLARFAAVVRAWPNSLASREAGLESLGLHEQARQWEALAVAARVFLRDHPDTPESADASRALTTALEERGQLAEAKRILRQLAARGGDRTVRADGRVVPAAVWAEERLKLPRFQRVADARGVPDLRPPLAAAWTFPDGAAAVPRPAPGAPAGAAVLRQARFLPFAGAEDLAPSGLFLLAVDRVVRAADGRTGQAAWERALPFVPRAAAALDDAILVIGDSAVVALRARSGEIAWQYESRTPFNRHAAMGGLYVVAAADPAAPVRTLLTALDPAGGRVAWSAAVPGFPVTELFGGGGHIAFVSYPPARVVSLDATTGQVEQVTAVDPSAYSYGAAFLHPDRLALVSTNGRVLCLVPETGATAWEEALEGARPVPGVKPAGGPALALVLSSGGARPQEVVAFDAATGKRVVACAGLPPPAVAGPVSERAILTDGTSVFVLLRGRERNEVILKAFEKTREAWSVTPPDVGADAVSLAHAPVLGERHVVLPLPRFKLPRGPWLPRVVVVEKATGRVVQDLLPGEETRSLTPPRIDVFNGALTILSDGTLRLFRGN